MCISRWVSPIQANASIIGERNNLETAICKKQKKTKAKLENSNANISYPKFLDLFWNFPEVSENISQTVLEHSWTFPEMSMDLIVPPETQKVMEKM